MGNLFNNIGDENIPSFLSNSVKFFFETSDIMKNSGLQTLGIATKL